MTKKRLFIFRVNGIDNCIVYDAEDARKLYEMLLEKSDTFQYENTDLNNLTTTYYFITK